MKDAQVIRIVGLVLVMFMVTHMVSPALANGDNPPFVKQGGRESGDDRDHGESAHGHQEHDEKERCRHGTPDSFTGVPNLTFDSSLVESTPHWIFLAAGEKEKMALLGYIDQASVSQEKRTEWKQFMKRTWERYPVRYEETSSGARLGAGKTSRGYSLTIRENETFREIERYIAEDMDMIHGNSFVVQFAGKTHSELMINALNKENLKDSYYQKIAEDSSQAPDDWYVNDPIPGQQQYNHGFVPIGINIEEIPSLDPTRVITGIGMAPDNAARYAQLSRKAFAERNYDGAFENMGYASHFISDLGNPYHTPNAHIIPLQFIDLPLSFVVLPNIQMLCDYKTLHDAYEDYANQHLGDFGDTDVSVDLLDPLQASKLHGSLSWGMSYPLIYQCYWHFVISRNLDFASSQGISMITRERITSTAMMNRGLVRFVTGGKPITYTITPSVNPGGSISPSSPVTITYGQAQGFTINPEPGYLIQDVKVNDRSMGPISRYTFDLDTINKGTGSQTIEAHFVSTSHASSDWVWARDGWGDWQHNASWSGTEMGPNAEYGPIIVGDHGSHGIQTNLKKGAAEASVRRTFIDPTGKGWRTLTFEGALSPSDRPSGRWMKIEVNGVQVFGATEADAIPGSSGETFRVNASFPQTSIAAVNISHGQNPAWGPLFAMDYYSISFGAQSDAIITTGQNLRSVVMGDEAMEPNSTEPGPEK
jgi:hypothetical protein